MGSCPRIAIILLLTAGIAACTTSGTENIRSEEAVHCRAGEQKVCRGGTATRIDRNEPDPTEFCTCQPQSTSIGSL